IKDIQQLISPELQALNKLIAETLDSPNELMNRIVDNYLRTKGKQIRPIMVILSAKLLGKVNENVIRAAAAVELLHNASLIHDDVVDETKIRRNMPTINGVWDNHIAVLVGDFFVSSSLQLAMRTGDIRIIDAIAKLGRLLSIGELDQIYCARFHNITEPAYMRNIERKTASLFMACVEMGGYAVGASDTDIANIREFARLLGLCFQIKDDIFDYYEDKNIGKPTGNDLREGKITLPLLHVLETDTSDTKAEMQLLSQQEVLSTDEINRLIDYAKSNGGIDYAYTTMERLKSQAAPLLDTFSNKEITGHFSDLIDYTIHREA
ncbi:MAG: polyprenyl synthetase family protein, partial [Muribaculaceae bacterium]|nr:polyprenyl synthetase family protein [Muribaculaceae bacterium]